MRRLPIVIAFALILSACGQFTADLATATPTATESIPMPPPTSEPTRAVTVPASALSGIQIDVWHAWFGTAADLFDTNVDAFNRTNPWGITVRAMAIENYNLLFDQVSASLGTETQPDLVIALPEQALTWDARRSVVVDLNPFIGDPEYGLAESERADFSDVFWAQDEVNGKRLGVPAARSSHFIFYNQTWARELGFSAPPLTAEDFKAQACAANATFRADEDLTNDGYGGWVADWTPEAAVSWMLTFGGGPLDVNADYAFAVPANQDALRFMKGLLEDNCAWLSNETEPYTALATRRALFISGDLLEVPSQLAAFRTAASADQWTLIAYPGLQGQVAMVEGPSFVVLQSSEKEQLATWLFARWMLSAENQLRWVEFTGALPLRTSLLPTLETYRGAHPQWGAAVDLLPMMRIQPQRASWRVVRGMVGDAVEDMFRRNVPSGQVLSILTLMDSTAHDLDTRP